MVSATTQDQRSSPRRPKETTVVRGARLLTHQRLKPSIIASTSNKETQAAKGGSDWLFVGDLPGHALSPFKWYRLL